jgi:hypothetical protein
MSSNSEILHKTDQGSTAPLRRELFQDSLLRLRYLCNQSITLGPWKTRVLTEGTPYKVGDMDMRPMSALLRHW